MAVTVFEVLADADRTRQASEYQYLGPYNELYAFVNPETGTAELFARRNDPYPGWHLVRGAYFYEFVSSMPN